MSNPSAGSKKTNTLPGDNSTTTSEDGRTTTINRTHFYNSRNIANTLNALSKWPTSPNEALYKEITSSDEDKKALSDSASPAKLKP